MFDDVGERLLDDAVGGEVDGDRKIVGQVGDGEGDVGAGVGEFVGEGRDVGQSGLWAEVVGACGVGAEHAEQVAELAEGLAAGSFDVAHGVDGGVEVVAGDGLGGAGLDGHHRDAVGDDVVEFAGDAGAFVGDGLACSGVLFGFEAFGAFLEEGEVVAAVADPAPDVPGQAGEDDGGGDVDALVVVDDRCR